MVISEKKTDPVFIVDSIRSELINRENVRGQPIKIFKATGEEIKQDLVSVTFYFFNRGKAPLVRETDVVNPLQLQLLDTAAEIVTYKILKNSRHDINPTLSRDTTASLPTINVDFTFLEPDDGFTGQITYLGNPRTELKIIGNVVGTRNLNEYRFTMWQYVRLNFEVWIVIGTATLGLLGVVSIIAKFIKENRNRETNIEKSTHEVNQYYDQLKQSVGHTTVDDFLKKASVLSEKYSQKKRYESPTSGIAVGVMIFLFVLMTVFLLWMYVKSDKERENRGSVIMQSIPEGIKP